MTGSRLALGLLCGLAICCSVMYLTSDGDSESVFSDVSVSGMKGPTSVDSEDVQKAGEIFTNTPDGRMRLVDYLQNVENEISEEEAARKHDVEAVKAQMARNFQFNQKARAKLKAAMLAKMATNAKKAHHDLKKSMAFVQKKFADAAALANKRNEANIKRAGQLRATIEANKKEAAAELKKAVEAQQEAMSTLKQSMNARIAQTDKNVATNAAQIKKNAEDASKALQSAVDGFDKKVRTAREEAAKGRSDLAKQLDDQDKANREYATNKLKDVIAQTSAQFQRVRKKMAEDREHADAELKTATTRMTASLNAFTALNDKRFQQTVKDIKTAKKEAEDRVNRATTEYKTRILQLRSTVNQQVAAANARVDRLTTTVTNNKIAQAKVNANVEAEMKRMVKLGNDRYQAHLQKDKDLKALIDKNQAATTKRMNAMAAHYAMELDEVRATMKKNRAHASHMLAKESANLYSQIAKSEREQHKRNNEMAEATRQAKLDIMNSLDEAKTDFTNKLGALHSTIIANDKKFEGKMEKLTGIVHADAVKNAEGRKHLKAIMTSNKADLHKAVEDAIHKGEQRMMQAETTLKNLADKTKASLNLRVTTQIQKLADRANSQIEGLRLQSKEARDEMRKEMLWSVRAAADEAKKNLDDAVDAAKTAFTAAEEQEAKAQKKAKKSRDKIAAKIEFEKLQASRSIKDAVGSMEKTLFVLKTETRKKIKKTNTKITAYGDALEKEAVDIRALMTANMNKLTQKITDAEEKAKKAISQANTASVAGFKKAMGTVKTELDNAAKAADDKFAGMYETMSQNRKEMESNLASATDQINDAIAKQAALSDSRFRKTVKDIKAARKEAKAEVSDARKTFATALAGLTAQVKDQETRLAGDLEVVAEMHLENSALQSRVNGRVDGELKRILKLTNDQTTKSARARGKLRALLDENKRAAHDEVNELDQLFETKIAKIRHDAAADSIEAARDLTTASNKMYAKLAQVQLKAAYDNKLSAAAIAKYESDAAADIAAAQSDFNSRLTTLTNVIASNAKKVEDGFEVLTGVVRDSKEASELDRKLIKKQIVSMGQDMNKRIVRAIAKGEADAKRVADRAQSNLRGMKKAMLIEIAERVEETADKLFKTIQNKHQVLADNYLSLKAYAVTAMDKLNDYVTKGKGKNLSSLGDLLTVLGGMSSIVAKKQEGVGMGGDTIPAIFTGAQIPVDATVSKINGLVNEYTKAANSVRRRWPMGLGKYLLSKLQESMLDKGVLQVDKVNKQAGNWVFLNGHAVGLSNKLNDFESLAVRMAAYESTLAKLTAALSGKVKHVPKPHPVFVPAPEWNGD